MPSDPAAEEAPAPLDDRARRMQAMVDAFVDEVTASPVDPDSFRRAALDAASLGEREIATTAAIASRLLDRPLQAMVGVADSTSPVARRLLELRRVVDDVNPARYELARSGRRRVLGVIPTGDRVREYFERYDRARERIAEIVAALTAGRAELERDAAAVAQEERSLAMEIDALGEYAELAARLDDGLERRLATMESTDPDRAGRLRLDLLYVIRRQRQEILTQLAVATQGRAALQIVQAHNREVIRAIDAATTATLSALRTAVMVAGALAGQRLALDRLEPADAAGAVLAGGAARSGPGEPPGIMQRATSAAVQLAALQRAWDEVFQALDGIDARRGSALADVRAARDDLAARRALAPPSSAAVPPPDEAPAGSGGTVG